MIDKIFVDPETQTKFEILENKLISKFGNSYLVENEIPNLIFPKKLNKIDQSAQLFYQGRADQYESTLHFTFLTHNENEVEVRNSFIDKLDLNINSKVLEIACGTGRDSVLIAKRLKGKKAELHLTDISEDMLVKCREKLKTFEIKTSFCLSNAGYLPYPDNYFDATYSFGAMGEFSDKKRALREMVRVTKIGGKIVFGDESVPEWLRKTEFYNILKKTNPMFSEKIPLEEMPIEARKTTLEWVIGGTFYLISFEVGEGEPKANFDFDIPGLRGGTYRTRYEGEIEGVKPDIKKQIYNHAKTLNVSVHDWLNQTLSDALKAKK